VVQLYPRALGSLSFVSYDSQGYSGGILSSLHTGLLTSSTKVEVEVQLQPTASRPVYLGVGLPSGAHGQILVFSLTIVGFWMWGAISAERMCLQFARTIASGSCQSSHSWVQVLQNSGPYSIVSYETPLTWGPGPHIHIHQDTGFPFFRLLRLTGL
jgi:hypothetical protein